MSVRLVFLIAERNLRSHSENVGFRTRLVLVVKTDGAVRAEVISVSSLGGKATFESIHSAACDHVSLSIHEQIDFFRSFVMMREVRSPRGEVHPEKARDHVRAIDGIALSVSRTGQQLVQN